MTEFYAHSANGDGRWHSLEEHLRAVAELAKEFSRPFGGEEFAYYAGLWHDLGKFDPEFQRYLAGERSRGPDHKGAGTMLAKQHLGPGGLIIQGHHGGLRANRHLQGWLEEKATAKAAIAALESARQAIPELEPSQQIKIPEFMRRDRLKQELWLRMIFSALVDADYLDTEQHFNPGRPETRASHPTVEQLWERFQIRHREATRGASGPVNQVRSEVYDSCLAAAERTTGIFRLTVPTGGGKTLSAMGFALKHATRHGLKRVIAATPFMSITQQTAAAYREFLEDEPNGGPSVVLEHHSMADLNEDEGIRRERHLAETGRRELGRAGGGHNHGTALQQPLFQQDQGNPQTAPAGRKRDHTGRGPDPAPEPSHPYPGHAERADGQLRINSRPFHRDTARLRDHQAILINSRDRHSPRPRPALPDPEASRLRVEDRYSPFPGRRWRRR